MDKAALFNNLIALAKGAASLIPGGALATTIGTKIVDLIDDFTEEAPPHTQAELAEAREDLATAVKAKAEAVARRLDG